MLNSGEVSVPPGQPSTGDGWLGQSGESCELRAPAKLMVKAGARRSFLTPLPQPPAEQPTADVRSWPAGERVGRSEGANELE